MSKVICLDIRALQIGHQNRGIGMYVRSVLEHLPADDNEYILYCFDNNNPIKELCLNLKFKYRLIKTPAVNIVLESPDKILDILRLVYHRFSPLKRIKIDTFVQFDAQLGIPRRRRTKTVVIGYDLIPLILRNEYNPGLRYTWRHSFGKRAKLRGVLRSIYYGFRYKLTCRAYKRADEILCISKASAESFKEILHVKSHRLSTIPLAPVFSSATADESIAESIGKPFIFYIGGTDSRKRISDLIHAFNVARGRGMNLALVLAGNEFVDIEKLPDVKGRDAIMSSPYRDDIRLVGFISNEQKMGLYSNALAFVFTSQYEGFGLPIIEAMQSGCPVISYDNSSIPEAAGTAALLVQTGDFVAIAKGISELTVSKTRDAMIMAGQKQAKKFNWDKYTSVFLEALK